MYTLSFTAAAVPANEAQLIESNESWSIGSFIDTAVDIYDQCDSIIKLIIVIVIICSFFKWLFSNKRKINSITKETISTLINNKKYVPGLFVELNESKECLRYLFYKNKWKHRIVAEFNALFHDYYGTLLKELFSNRDIVFKLSNNLNINEIINLMTKTKNSLKLLQQGKIKIPERYSKSAQMFQTFSNVYRIYSEVIDDLIKKAHFIKARYIILTGSAGNGKTNLLCSFSEFLIKHNKRCVFINGKDIKISVEEHFWAQIGFPKILTKSETTFCIFKYLFWKLLSLGLPLYILIDAVNENDSKQVLETYRDFLGTVLHKRNTYIIVTCRSEYFEARFRKHLVDDLDISPVIEDIVEEPYSSVAVDRLFDNYADAFNYHSKLTYQVKEHLSKQLLLTRIFFETYSNRSEQVSDLDLHALYELYIERVSKEHNVDVRSYLDEIAKIMLKQKNYISVPLANISAPSKMTHDAIDGTILISKTIVHHADSLLKNEEEYVYFVFDELRDYCLARYRLKNMCSSPDEYPSNDNILSFLNELNADNAVCLEGVINYVYREGQKRKNCDLCRIILYKFIDTAETNTQHRRATELGRGTRLILDNPSSILVCEKEFLCKKLQDKNTGYASMLFSYFVAQELYEGSPNLNLFFDLLKNIGSRNKIEQVILRCISNWRDRCVSLKDLIDIDKRLINISYDSVKRFRKFEILCILLLPWNTKVELVELVEYLKEKIQPDELGQLFEETAAEFDIRSTNNDYNC